jgi:hypothetical protein
MMGGDQPRTAVSFCQTFEIVEELDNDSIGDRGLPGPWSTDDTKTAFRNIRLIVGFARLSNDPCFNVVKQNLARTGVAQYRVLVGISVQLGLWYDIRSQLLCLLIK